MPTHQSPTSHQYFSYGFIEFFNLVIFIVLVCRIYGLIELTSLLSVDGLFLCATSEGSGELRMSFGACFQNKGGTEHVNLHKLVLVVGICTSIAQEKGKRKKENIIYGCLLLIQILIWATILCSGWSISCREAQ